MVALSLSLKDGLDAEDGHITCTHPASAIILDALASELHKIQIPKYDEYLLGNIPTFSYLYTYINKHL